MSSTSMAPLEETPTGASPEAGAQAPSEQGEEAREKPTKVDIFDMSLSNESEAAIDVEADAFSSGPPPPDGIYRAKVSVIDGSTGFEKRKDKKGDDYYACDLQSHLVAPGEKFDGRPVRDRFVSTMVMQSTGTCRVAGVLRALRVEVATRTPHVMLARQLAQTLAAEPICRVETRWKASAQKSDNSWVDLAVGMRRFPTDEKGEHIPTLHFLPTTGQVVSESTPGAQEVNAFATVFRYLPLEQG